jgi:hypothetical protein
MQASHEYIGTECPATVTGPIQATRVRVRPHHSQHRPVCQWFASLFLAVVGG